MLGNAVYLTAAEMREVSDLIIENTMAEGPNKLGAMFHELAQRYPADQFKIKVILALK